MPSTNATEIAAKQAALVEALKSVFKGVTTTNVMNFTTTTMTSTVDVKGIITLTANEGYLFGLAKKLESIELKV